MFYNCDCGLTGGCEKCNPRISTVEHEIVFPESREENFMSDDLKEFYRKKGYNSRKKNTQDHYLKSTS